MDSMNSQIQISLLQTVTDFYQSNYVITAFENPR